MKYITGKIQTELFNCCLNTGFQMRVLKISSRNDYITCSSAKLAAQQLVYNSFCDCDLENPVHYGDRYQ